MQRDENDVDRIGEETEVRLPGHVAVDQHVREEEDPEQAQPEDQSIGHAHGAHATVTRLVRADQVTIDASEEEIRLGEKPAGVNEIITKFAQDGRGMVRMNAEAVIENGADETDVQLKCVGERRGEKVSRAGRGDQFRTDEDDRVEYAADVSDQQSECHGRVGQLLLDCLQRFDVESIFHGSGDVHARVHR